MAKMTKVDAVISLLEESHRLKRSDTGAHRILRACKALGIEPGSDTWRVFSWLDYCNPANGTPYGTAITRIW